MTSASDLVSTAFATASGTTIRLPANDLDVIQDMIDISADRLEGLRTQCVTSATLTQHEIRSLETKLVRMFSELLLTKARLNERIPASGLPNTTGNELKQWLRVVGLSNESLAVCLQRLSTLEQLMAQSDEEIKQLLGNNPQYKEEELRRLTKAMENLRKCKHYLTAQRANGSSSMVDITNVQDVRASSDQLMEHLYWDSWDRHHHHHHHHRGSMGNIGVSLGSSSPRLQRLLAKHQQQQQLINSSSSHQSPTLTPSPPNSPFSSSSSHIFTANPIASNASSGGGSLNGTPHRQRPAGTPPPIRKHQTHQLTNAAKSMTPTHHAYQRQTQALPTQAYDVNYSSTTLPLAKSHSNEAPFHDSVLFSLASSPPSLTAISSINNSTTTMTTAQSISKATSRTRLHTDPSPESYSSSASSDIVGINENTNTNNNNNQQNNNNINTNNNNNINNNNNNNNNISNNNMMNNNINNNNNNSSSSHNLQVPQPRSPCASTIITTLGMGHTISHRFTKVFKMMSTCDLCQKQMFFGLKCKECKYRCHKDCEVNVPPSCGLPREFVDEFKRTFTANAVGATVGINNSPNLSMTPLGKKRLVGGIVKGADSSSPGSSCNSSTPSSPALFNLPQQQQQQLQQQQQQHYHQQQQYYQQQIQHNILQGHQQQNSNSNLMSSSAGGSSSTSSNMLSTPSSYYNKSTSQFNFPDVTITSSISSNCAHGNNMGHNGAANVDTTQTIFSALSVCNNSDMADFHGSATELEAKAILMTDDTIISNTLTASYDSSTAINTNNNINSISTSSTTLLQTASTTLSKDNTNTTTSSNASISALNKVCTDSTTFYPRKLSSAGVDRRVPFTASELSDTNKSNDSDKTVSLSGSTSASTDSDRTPRRLDSTEDGDSVNWPRQNSLSLKEWDIPYGDLRLLEQIGRGRFGTVHRALWHGDVAVKLLKEDYLHDEHMLEAFKLEVANFKKTRHENLVLFMGACMNPPYLAIVTSLCKGNTLYTYIHARRDKFTINKTTLVAQQISQGMGYLHARGIYHKDLRTKNIFLENGKVIITDFGLFSSTKLLYCDIGLGVPSGWLCYLAPELMRALQPSKPMGEVLPFSKASDVYSFGTVWYELLCGEFPFKSQPPEAIIWQVGRGMKQTLANLQTSRDVKDILMLCWHYQADDRPDFPKLLTLLERLPKKRLARSPSHPVQLSRSAESVF